MMLQLQCGKYHRQLLAASLCVSVASILVLIYMGRRHSAALLGLSLAAAFAVFALFLVHLGLPVLPSSVLVKSGALAEAVDSRFFGFVGAVLKNILVNAKSSVGALFFVSIAVFLLRVSCRGGRLSEKGLMSLVAVFCLAGHLVLGDFGWFGRYEIYALVLLATAAAYVFSDELKSVKRWAFKWRAFVLVLIVFSCLQYIDILIRSPLASQGIYHQHYQLHRFSKGFFPYPVAVNDIGLVSYENDQYVLDLYGLASDEVRKLRSEELFDATAVRSIVRKSVVKYAMIYDDWFDAIPEGWTKLATLTVERVTAAHSEVSFYLIDGGMRDEMCNALGRFAPTLPDNVEIEMQACL